jgi:hypothetical protein
VIPGDSLVIPGDSRSFLVILLVLLLLLPTDYLLSRRRLLLLLLLLGASLVLLWCFLDRDSCCCFFFFFFFSRLLACPLAPDELDGSNRKVGRRSRNELLLVLAMASTEREGRIDLSLI